MGHDHGALSAAGRHRWRLVVTFGLIATFFAVELVAGIITGSLALLSDAGHMAADVVALGSALVATRLAARGDRTGRRTYGSYRAEIFASGFIALLMLGMAIAIAASAVARIGEPVEVETGPMLVVGTLGLIVNLVAMLLLRAGAKQSLNLKGAYLEVLADTLGSVGVIAAALLVRATGDTWWDTAVAVAIGVFVAVRAVMLGREVLQVLGQNAPDGLDPAAIETRLRAIPGIEEVHDLHLWTLTSGMDVATAHLVVSDDPHDMLDRANAALREDFGIEHATLQIEPTSHDCHHPAW
ncbi:cation diffusion facilitator family transporter [Parenemella sanctibonifatiensis]|uniref:Cation transporter n=1 Tax=Parenemella sanctibonifatiensis TaxID=2016505 RepID=A0A255EDW2_9ACTN|nr:cation diffusion facilitator family transporter [Parenemella sanctibonifatiensis]OYN89440.1 cation transporter [Parenemella sanctibonifatiensis]